jgi:UDP-glucose 4-epimerase
MRVMVTGGAGYIGAVITWELAARGHDVVVYDNLTKGHADSVAGAGELVQGDLLDGETLRRTLSSRRIEAVVHMAASSLVGESVAEPDRYYRNNVEAGLQLLAAMRVLAVRDLVFSSTAAVYGEPSKQPIEESDPTIPTNPYGETKLTLERAFPWYARAYGLRHVSLRYFNAAGATDRCGERHDPETHLIPIVLEAARSGGEVTVFGDDYPTPDGTCVRDYIHVLDLARAHVAALDALAQDRPVAPAYNLGCGGDGYSVNEVIEAAREVTGRPVRVKMGPRRAGDPAVLVATSDRIRRELAWRPNLQDLRAIVESAWRWLEAQSPR